MARKFFIRGYKKQVDSPFFFDEEKYSFEDARKKAKEYFKRMAPLCKVIIFEQKNGEKKAARLIYRNETGQPEEIGNWWENI